MSKERKRCSNCPKNFGQKDWLRRLLCVDDVRSACGGPELLTVGGEIDVDYRKAASTTERYKAIFCGQEVTPQMRSNSAILDRAIEERTAACRSEIAIAWARMSEEQKLAISETLLVFRTERR